MCQTFLSVELNNSRKNLEWEPILVGVYFLRWREWNLGRNACDSQMNIILWDNRLFFKFSCCFFLHGFGPFYRTLYLWITKKEGRKPFPFFKIHHVYYFIKNLPFDVKYYASSAKVENLIDQVNSCSQKRNNCLQLLFSSESKKYKGP